MKIEGNLQEFKELFGIGYHTINKGDCRIVDIENKTVILVFMEVHQSYEVVELGPLNSRIYNPGEHKLVAQVI